MGLKFVIAFAKRHEVLQGNSGGHTSYDYSKTLNCRGYLNSRSSLNVGPPKEGTAPFDAFEFPAQGGVRRHFGTLDNSEC